MHLQKNVFTAKYLVLSATSRLPFTLLFRDKIPSEPRTESYKKTSLIYKNINLSMQVLFAIEKLRKNRNRFMLPSLEMNN